MLSARNVTERELRVFVSSTFRDMHRERDVLTKHVFPAVRKLCDERGVTFVDVDLRWGITQEQAADNQLLALCLAEIDRCRPFFIGLLGERYGSSVEAIEPALVEKLPWLLGAKDRSITEIEIMHGVLTAPQAPTQSFFYFRNPQYARHLPIGVEQRAVQSEDSASAARLADLKQRIRKSGLPVRENYADPATLGELVLVDLMAAVNALFPEQVGTDQVDREATRHSSVEISRFPGYVGRLATLKSLDMHAQIDEPPLLVHGASGLGKTSLLASWAKQWRRTHPQDLVLTHFVGATPDSVDASSMLRRIAAELARTLGIEASLLSEAGDTRTVLPRWLQLASKALTNRATGGARGRLVLVIDAVDRLQGRDGVVDLTWLPNQIPMGVSVVVSSAPGPALLELLRRGWSSIEVTPLSEAECGQLANSYLAIYGKGLPADLLRRLITAPQAATPLYLRALLDELRLHGHHETLTQSLEYYLGAGDVPALYQLILARWEAEYARDRPGLVHEAMSLLWAARKGLSEHELLALLGTPNRPLPRAHWSGLFLAAEHALINRGGELGFFHDSLRQAVERRYLSSKVDQKAAHLKLAMFFASGESPVFERRRLEELPWQLIAAEAWGQLGQLFADPTYLNSAWELDQHALLRFAARLAQEGRISLASLFASVIRDPGRYDHHHVHTVSQLLIRGHEVSAGCALQDHLIERLRTEGDPEDLVGVLNNRALTLNDAGEHKRAFALHTEQANIVRQSGDQQAELALLINMARALEMRGDYVPALEHITRAEHLAKMIGSLDQVQRALGIRANIARAQGRLDQAQALYEEVEDINRQTGNIAGLSETLALLAEMAAAEGDLKRSALKMQEAEQFAHMSGDYVPVVSILSTRARIAHESGDLDRALALYEEAQAHLPGEADTHLLLPLLGNRAAIMFSRGQHREALEIFERLEEMSRAAGHKLSLTQALANQGAVWLQLRAPERAVSLSEEAAGLARDLQHYQLARTALNNLRMAAARIGQADKAVGALDEEMALCQTHGDHDGYAALAAMKKNST